MRLDVRAIWNPLTVVEQIYLIFLFGTGALAVLRSAQTIWSIRQIKRIGTEEGRTLLNQLTIRVYFLRQLLTLNVLLLGVVLANEVFATLRAVQLSFLSLTEYRLQEALEVPTAFAFLWLLILTCLHILQWIVDARIRRQFHKSQFFVQHQ